MATITRGIHWYSSRPCFSNCNRYFQEEKKCKEGVRDQVGTVYGFMARKQKERKRKKIECGKPNPLCTEKSIIVLVQNFLFRTRPPISSDIWPSRVFPVKTTLQENGLGRYRRGPQTNSRMPCYVALPNNNKKKEHLAPAPPPNSRAPAGLPEEESTSWVS